MHTHHKHLRLSVLLVSLLYGLTSFGQSSCEINNTNCIEAQEKVGPVDRSALNIVNVIPSPAAQTLDIAFDGQFLWVGSDVDSLIYKISPSDGTVFDTIKTRAQRPQGITYIDGYLWVADNGNDSIHKVDPSTGNSIHVFKSPNSLYDAGLAWSGNYLWHSDASASEMQKIDTSGLAISTTSLSFSLPYALAFDGNYLWLGDNSKHMIYKLDTSLFAVIDSFASPKQFPNGLSSDGQYLWVAENESSPDSIFQIDISGISTGIQSPEAITMLDVKPNPSRNSFFISSDEPLTSAASIIVHNTTGQVVHTIELDVKSIWPVEIDLMNQPSGIYLCQLISEKEKQSVKLVKH